MFFDVQEGKQSHALLSHNTATEMIFQGIKLQKLCFSFEVFRSVFPIFLVALEFNYSNGIACLILFEAQREFSIEFEDVPRVITANLVLLV